MQSELSITDRQGYVEYEKPADLEAGGRKKRFSKSFQRFFCEISAKHRKAEQAKKFFDKSLGMKIKHLESASDWSDAVELDTLAFEWRLAVVRKIKEVHHEDIASVRTSCFGRTFNVSFPIFSCVASYYLQIDQARRLKKQTIKDRLLYNSCVGLLQYNCFNRKAHKTAEEIVNLNFKNTILERVCKKEAQRSIKRALEIAGTLGENRKNSIISYICTLLASATLDQAIKMVANIDNAADKDQILVKLCKQTAKKNVDAALQIAEQIEDDSFKEKAFYLIQNQSLLVNLPFWNKLQVAFSRCLDRDTSFSKAWYDLGGEEQIGHFHCILQAKLMNFSLRSLAAFGSFSAEERDLLKILAHKLEWCGSVGDRVFYENKLPHNFISEIFSQSKTCGGALLARPFGPHALLYQIEQQADGLFTFSILNSGEGLSWHHKNGEYSQLAAVWSNLNEEMIRKFDYEGLMKLDNTETIYMFVKTAMGRDQDARSENPNLYHKEQLQGTCSQQVFHVFFHTVLPKPLYLKVKLGLTDEIIDAIQKEQSSGPLEELLMKHLQQVRNKRVYKCNLMEASKKNMSDVDEGEDSWFIKILESD